MSGDDVTHPKSAFVPFSNGMAYPSPSDIITTRPFAYLHPTQDHVTRSSCWYPTNVLSAPSQVPISRCFGQVDPTGLDDNVANCVTVANDEAGNVINQLIHDQSFAPCSGQVMFNSSPAVSKLFPAPMPAPVVPLIIQPQIVRSENLPPRQVYYHKRHHPSTKTTSNFDISASELKNKSRFSATGASGKSTVVRDCKMSLSSSPPSPCAGSVGGSLCSSISRSHFKPISAQCQLFASSTRNSTTALPYSPTKKVSGTSVSPTRPSGSPSSRSSTSSFSGTASRKRRADEENATRGLLHSSGSTSDVTAGVGHVRLCDRSSTGSVSPVDTVMRTNDWVSPQQPHKRSKNDNDEDDDVIFVSMEPGSKQKSMSPGLPLKPFTGVPPKQTVKSSRKSKKVSTKKSLTNSIPSTPFSMPSPIYPPLPGLHQLSSAVPTSFVAPPVATMCTIAAVPLTSTATSKSKGYFLRSTVNTRNVNKGDLNKNSSHHQAQTISISANARYQTRSNQKRKEDEPRHPNHQVAPVETSVGSSTSVSSNTQTKPPSSSVHVSDVSVGSSHHPKSVESTERSRTILLNDPHRRASSTSFSKIYDIKGKIGVGGGGVVYAGTRKSDDVEVAIKRVPREKVKRWGKLDGRVVPIEFELLFRAAKSGNKGVIKMYDWFERRSSYILVMERPQPVIDLFDYLNQHGAMPEAAAKKIFRQIVDAVRHCHANGVIHRDIKDENVLLNLHTSEAKLIDFGCGTFMKNEPYTEFAGTPEFYPPEWFTDRRYEGRKVDAWSLGVLLFTMLEAEVPFQKEEDIVRCELRHKKLQGSSSASCRDLIKQMLRKDQSKRLSLVEVLQHPWLSEDATSSVNCPPRGSGSSKVVSSAALPSNSTPNSTTVSPLVSNNILNHDKQVYQPMVVMQYKEESPAKTYPYLASPMSQNVVHTNECAVHS